MIFRYKFSDVDIRKIGFITSNFYEIDDDLLMRESIIYKLAISAAAPLSKDLCKKFGEFQSNKLTGYFNNKEATDACIDWLHTGDLILKLKEEIKDFVSQRVDPREKLHCVHFIDKIPKNSAGNTLRKIIMRKS
ncbi:hypothetical protein RhiirC2_710241 [Rhizophagus irregularis]|uniref:AMP-binding enzyme C-terminal domain-containing protein n=1 Tax=Rhizophagus irregularis TaxID=588596 RepID=A0A2N1NFJ4_9GLOM|nr:hypothetical protein RhiirC2_710241 [Rhizophagus irregularis]